jgi:hypothetical protein
MKMPYTSERCKPRHKEHDFGAKLRQKSVIGRLQAYIRWIRAFRKGEGEKDILSITPVSINLDLTATCNFACPHCVDSGIINTGKRLETQSLLNSIDFLVQNGLLSVILIGGGEPTLHKGFEKIVEFLKLKNLQVGIVTNGSNLKPLINIASILEKKDWVRLSLDAGSESTFQQSHRPNARISLKSILKQADVLKSKNPDVSLGYSFVIVWEGIHINGKPLYANIHEMTDAVRLADRYGFDYISFKPCLVRLPGSLKESLLTHCRDGNENAIIHRLKRNLQAARQCCSEDLSILESVNLTALIENAVDEMKHQPKTCHMQPFNTIVTPSGIYHCPAFRGVEKQRIAAPEGYLNSYQFKNTAKTLSKSLRSFNAEKECSVVACFYHHVNWWIENFIESGLPVEAISYTEDDNFFL